MRLCVVSVNNIRFIPQTDRRLNPLYATEDAAEYLGIPRRTLREWAFGRPRAGGKDEYPPVLQFVDQRIRRLSFYDLIEAHILRAAIEKHLSLRQIKRGLAFLREKHPDNPRPLLTYDFMTDGKHLLVGGMLGGKQKDPEALVNASRSGQLEMTPIIESYLRLIGRDANRMPDTLFPTRGGHVISITSGVVSGKPVIEGTRITTAIIAQRVLAGETPEEVARDYRLPLEKIEAAINFETAA